MRWVLRWQRPLLAAAFALLLLAAVLGAASGGSDGGDPVETATGPTTTTSTTRQPSTTSSTTSTSTVTTVTTVPGGSSTTGTTSTTRPPRGLPRNDRPAPTEPEPDPEPDPTTPITEPGPTTPPCRNSRDPACGTFYWDPPPPPNQPIEIVIEPSHAGVLQPVTITVTVRDPDAQHLYVCLVEGIPDPPPCTPPPAQTDERYGPWTPPNPIPGHGQTEYQATFLIPGEKHVKVEVWSWLEKYGDLYSNHQTGEKVIIVG